MNRTHLTTTINRMAGFLLLQNLHFHHPWWSAAGVEPPWMADIYSSAIAPVLP
jgi:hypothetical protein